MTNFKNFLIVFFISFLAVIFETTVFNFPFVFLLASILLLFTKKILSYLSIFILGFIIDAVRVSNFGMTPIFILATVVCILLYEKYSGSKDVAVAFFIIAAMAFVYVYFLSYSLFLLAVSFVLLILANILFNILKKKGIIFA